MMVVSTTGRVHIRGPLGAHVEGFEAELVRLGFAPTSVVNQLRMAAHLNRWLDAQSLGVEDLTVERVEAFIRERRASYTALFSRRALRPLLGWLAASGVIAAEVALPRRDLLARWAPVSRWRPRAIPSSKDSSNATTDSWKQRSFPAGLSPHRPISTPNLMSGCFARTTGSFAPPARGQSTLWTLIGR